MTLRDAVVAQAADQLVAHPVALLAIPAMVPAVAVIGAILYVARQDRKAEREEAEALERAAETKDEECTDAR